MNVLINGVVYVPAPELPTGRSLSDALEVRMNADIGDNITIRDYLRELLLTLWAEKEGFNGKRPFGNSGWDYELYKPLVNGGFVSGKIDEWDDMYEVDEKEADKYVHDLILTVFNGDNDGL